MELFNTFLLSLKVSIKITLIIFILMIIIELLVLKYKDKIIEITEKNRLLRYITPSFFGSVPGCIGTFAMDSLYMVGLLSFGGIVAAMVATFGDEAFLLISLAITGEITFPTIVYLMLILFVLGISAGFLGDFFIKKTKMKFCEKCMIVHHKEKEFNFGHFLKVHIRDHIIKKHIWQIFLWIFAAIFVIEILQSRVNIEAIFGSANMFYILIAAAMIGILPISGPNIILVMMFSKGLIPFSVLLTNSIIQDGHGLLPIIGFSIKDAIKIKAFNLAFGLAVGSILLFLGF